MAYAPTPAQLSELAGYLPLVQARCRVRIRNRHDADDVAQNVMLRLLAELRRGKTYTVPLPVVVNNVIRWKIKEYWDGRSYEAELDAALATADPFEEIEGNDLLRSLVARLPGRQRQVATLRLLERLEPDQIAARLGIKRNAVDQAWNNAKRKLRAMLDDE